MALGSSFSATQAGMEESADRQRRPGAQQALQTLSLELPKSLGADQMAPSASVLGAFRPGSQDAASAQLSRMMRAMTSRAKVRKPTAPKQTAQAAAVAGRTAPPAMPTAAPATAATKPPKKQGGGGFQDEDAQEAPEPGDLGGGYVDSIPNPPAQMAPPAQQAPAPSSPAPGSGAYDTNDPYGPGGAPAGTSGYYDNQGNYHPMGNYQTNRAGSGQASGAPRAY